MENAADSCLKQLAAAFLKQQMLVLWLLLVVVWLLLVVWRNAEAEADASPLPFWAAALSRHWPAALPRTMQLTDNVTASSCSRPCFTSPLVGPRVAQLAGWVGTQSS